MTEPRAIPETVLPAPLACWHESLLSARTDRVVALACDSAIVETSRPLPVGTRVFLELSLGQASNAARGEIDAVVVDGTLPGREGFRVRFVELDEALRTWIAHFLNPPEAVSPSPTWSLDDEMGAPERPLVVAPLDVPQVFVAPASPAPIDVPSPQPTRTPAPVLDAASSFDPFADILTPAPIAPADVPLDLLAEPHAVETIASEPVTAEPITLDAVPAGGSAVIGPTVDAPARDTLATAPADADLDDEPLSISPAEPLRAMAIHDGEVHDLGRQFDDAFSLSPFDAEETPHAFAPSNPLASTPSGVPDDDWSGARTSDDDEHSALAWMGAATSPDTLPNDAFAPFDTQLAPTSNIDDGAADTASDDEGALYGALTSSLGELDPFDAFDAFNAARRHGTPAHGLAPLSLGGPQTASPLDEPHANSGAPVSNEAASITTGADVSRDGGVPIEGAEPGFVVDETADAFTSTGPRPMAALPSERHVTTLRFDGRPVRQELDDDAKSAVRNAVSSFPNTQTDPQFGVFVPPRTDPMFPSVQGSDDELRAALARVSADVSPGLSFNDAPFNDAPFNDTPLPDAPFSHARFPSAPSSNQVAGHDVPLGHHAPYPSLARVPAIAHGVVDDFHALGLPDDVVEVSSTSQLVEVARAADGSVSALGPVSHATPIAARVASPKDIDVAVVSGELADDADTDELPLVVGSDAAAPFDPFVTDDPFNRRR
jgi:hypothetical protein